MMVHKDEVLKIGMPVEVEVRKNYLKDEVSRGLMTEKIAARFCEVEHRKYPTCLSDATVLAIDGDEVTLKFEKARPSTMVFLIGSLSDARAHKSASDKSHFADCSRLRALALPTPWFIGYTETTADESIDACLSSTRKGSKKRKSWMKSVCPVCALTDALPWFGGDGSIQYGPLEMFWTAWTDYKTKKQVLTLARLHARWYRAKYEAFEPEDVVGFETPEAYLSRLLSSYVTEWEDALRREETQARLNNDYQE